MVYHILWIIHFNTTVFESIIEDSKVNIQRLKCSSHVFMDQRRAFACRYFITRTRNRLISYP